MTRGPGAFWTEQKLAELRRLYRAGLSAGQIYKEIGAISRNAVVGKINYLGLSAGTKGKGGPRKGARMRSQALERKDVEERLVPSSVTHSRSATIQRVSVKKVTVGEAPRNGKASRQYNERSRSVSLPAFGIGDNAPIELTELEETEAGATEENVSFFDAREHHCRWPIGDHFNLETFRFCGARKLAAGSFCGQHAALAYQPQSRSPRRGTPL